MTTHEIRLTLFLVDSFETDSEGIKSNFYNILKKAQISNIFYSFRDTYFAYLQKNLDELALIRLFARGISLKSAVTQEICVTSSKEILELGKTLHSFILYIQNTEGGI